MWRGVVRVQWLHCARECGRGECEEREIERLTGMFASLIHCRSNGVEWKAWRGGNGLNGLWEGGRPLKKFGTPTFVPQNDERNVAILLRIILVWTPPTPNHHLEVPSPPRVQEPAMFDCGTNGRFLRTLFPLNLTAEPGVGSCAQPWATPYRRKKIFWRVALGHACPLLSHT